MNAPIAGMGKESRRQFLLWSLAALAVAFLAINSSSFWIDEALTGLKARQPDLASWWRLMVEEKGSDLQMPLYMAYIWGFARIFGTSEIALRAANIPWFVFGVATFVIVIPPQRRRIAAIVALTSPFAWYYLNEARPYAMQFGSALIVFAALSRLRSIGNQDGASNDRWIWIFLIGIAGLMGSSLLGMIFAAAACSCVPIVLQRDRCLRLIASHRATCAFGAGVFLAMAAYYLWTLSVGARASPAANTDLRSLGFIFYELLGFDGLGPGRLEIREGRLGTFAEFVLPLALYGIVLIPILVGGLTGLWRGESRSKAIALAVTLVVPAVLVVCAGFVLHFRVLARHLTPLMAPTLFLLVTGLGAQLSKPSWRGRVTASGFLALSIVSCLELRFVPRHQKDDYRGAAAIAASASAEHKIVWWNASHEGAEYYRLLLARDDVKPGSAVFVSNPLKPDLSTLRQPDVVIVTKPDLFDGLGTVSGYLREKSYSQSGVECRAFTIWERRK